MVAGAKAKVSSWYTFGKASLSFLTGSAINTGANYKQHLEEFRTKFEILSQEIAKLKAECERISKLSLAPPKDSPIAKVELFVKMLQFGNQEAEAQQKLDSRIQDCIILPLEVSRLAHQAFEQ
jgi:hypothetical protein